MLEPLTFTSEPLLSWSWYASRSLSKCLFKIMRHYHANAAINAIKIESKPTINVPKTSTNPAVLLHSYIIWKSAVNGSNQDEWKQWAWIIYSQTYLQVYLRVWKHQQRPSVATPDLIAAWRSNFPSDKIIILLGTSTSIVPINSERERY